MSDDKRIIWDIDPTTPEEIQATPEEIPEETIREPRETRAVDQDDDWVPPSNLPDLIPKPGYVCRWVRTSQLGTPDNSNVSMRFREGWVPVLASEHPEVIAESDINSQFKGNIEIGGLLACTAPRELMEKRQRYYDKLANSQMQAVDNTFMNENDPRMPLLQPDRKTRTTFGRG